MADKSKNTEVRYARQEDVVKFFDGKNPLRTFRGAVILDNDEPVIIGGIYRDKQNQIAFADFKVDPNKYKREIILATRLVVKLMNKYHTVFALVSQEETYPSARTYIKHYGFVPFGGKSNVFIWKRDEQ